MYSEDIIRSNNPEESIFANRTAASYSDDHSHSDTALQDNNGTDISTNWNEVILTFDKMDLKENLLRGIYGYGFEHPSPIQQRAIKPVLMGKDVIAQAQSGK